MCSILFRALVTHNYSEIRNTQKMSSLHKTYLVLSLYVRFKLWLIRCWAFVKFVVKASCSANMSASGVFGPRSPSEPRLHFSHDSGTVPDITSFKTAHISRTYRKRPPS